MSMRKVAILIGLVFSIQPRVVGQIRYMQSASSMSTQNTSGVSASFTSNTTAGNAIVVAVAAAGSAISSVVDTQGNTYAQAVASGSDAIWYATNIHGGADTVTANFAASTGFSLIYIHEYAGLATSAALDQVSSQVGTGTAVTSGAKTTTQANELIFGYAAVDHRVSGGGTGFTVRQTAGGNMSEDMTVSVVGTYTATFTQSSSGAWVGLMATFKAAASGPPPPTLQSISVTPGNPSIAVGGSPLQLTATGTYSDSSTQNITSSCTWTSNATGVATVNSAGQVTGVGTGSAKITCTVGSVSGFTTVTVTAGIPAIRYVQSTSNVSTQNASGVSASASNTTAGNAIVVAVAAAGPAISSVVDTQGNTYAQAVASGSDAIWYATNIHGGADTVTANFAASTGFSLIYIHEYAGLATSAALDQVSSQAGTGTAVTSGAKTTTQANELIFGYAAVDHRVSGGGTGFTVRQTAGGNMSEDMTVSVVGTYTATFTQSSSGAWVGLMATFKAAASGPPPPTLQSISVTPGNPSIAVGGSPLQLTATGTYSDSSTQNITSSCTWTSNATGVATVNSAGQVTGVGTGSAKITCTVGSVSGFTTVTVTAGVAAIAINSGGPAASSFVADIDYSGGTTINHPNTIDTSKVASPAPAAVYQTARIGNFAYTIGGFIAGSSNTVRLHFAETYWTAAAQREFNVSINGTQVLTNFDIFKTAGGQNIANIQQFTEVANSSGQYVIQFTSVIDNSLVSGIEVLPLASCTAPTTPTGLTATAASSSQIDLSWSASSSTCSGITYNVFRSTSSGFTPSSSNQIASGVTATAYSDTGLIPSTTYFYVVEATNLGGTSGPSNQAGASTPNNLPIMIIGINAGGSAANPFLADTGYSGGTTINHPNTINTSKVSNPAPAAVYQTARIGNFTYTIGGLTAGTNYLVRLHFAETFWTAVGQRVFNVSINGTQVLTNFDIFKTAGGQNIANIQQFTQTANASGQFVIAFTSVIDNALVSGIELDSSSTSPTFSLSAAPSTEPVAAGSQTTYTVTIGALNGFTGKVALSASGLPSGATANFSPASISGSGTSTLTVSTSSSTPAASSSLTLTATSGSQSLSTTVTLIVAVTTNGLTAAQIVSQMSIDQIATELHGIQDANDYRVVPGISSLGIPLLNITNGPAGATNGGPGHEGNATALPAPISLAATWDPNLANQYGAVIGVEAKDLANGFVEAPDINIARTLQNGRTFEGFGEDPYLAGQIAVGEIAGIQSQGVIAESKHFAANNQETDRLTINEIIDERTLREIYLPAFEATVKQGNVGGVMCAFNQITVSNGPSGSAGYMCENNYLLNHILKQEWGFQGFVTSDFPATHSTVGSANAGLDVEMPTGNYFVSSALQTAVAAGQVSMATLDDKLMRRFVTMMQFNIFPNAPSLTGISTATQQSDGAIARQIAEAGMVLLQNNGGILPLNASSLHSIAVIGPYAGAAMTGGGGSSLVTPLYTVAPVTGIRNRVGSGVTVTYVDGSNISAAVSLAQAANIAIVMVGDSESEGADYSISLSGTQDSLVEQVVAGQPKTIVVMKSGTGILMPWAASVPAILQAWYPGEEDGNAVAAVLFGDVNPSGKLPLTFPVRASDPDPPADGSAPAQYPGVSVNGVPTATYSEGVFVGYRHYDANNIVPLFPFGYGLSYTTFSFSNLNISPSSFTFTNNPNQTVTVTFNVTNTGKVAGAEVAQLYVGIPSPSQTVPEPPNWLKGFQKIKLTPGQTGPVQLTLSMRSFAYWDVTSESWRVAPGTYQIKVGDSSRNILLQGLVTIN